jgi:4-hydroxybenzoate polyprenyltransferase
MINDWEDKIDNSKLKDKKNYDLGGIYEHAHSELSLQQSKRDQIITIYLALCSFLLPFVIGEELISILMKGVLFFLLGIVGMLFSCITVRYREYKEAYWLCCQALTVLSSFEDNELNKTTVQRAFYHCLQKKGHKYLVDRRGEKRFKKRIYVKNNINSSETMYFVIMSLMSSLILGLGVAWILRPFCGLLHIIVGVITGLTAFFLLWCLYFGTCIRIYRCLEVRNREGDKERRDGDFNKVFSKAWFLHFYYDAK